MGESTVPQLKQKLNEERIKNAKLIRLVDFMGKYIGNIRPRDIAFEKEVQKRTNEILY